MPNGLVLSSFLQGQRQADEDQRIKQRFELEQQRARLGNDLSLMQNDRYAQETPYNIAGLSLRNDAQALQNSRMAQETPLSVNGLMLQNSARQMQNDRYAQETPLYTTGLELRNTGQQAQNDRYTQLTPLALTQQNLANTGNEQLNQQRQLALDTTRQLQPTKNALELQSYTKQMGQHQLMQGIQSYMLTGNVDPLRQAINATFGGNVSITPTADGRVHVKDHDGEHTFNNANELISALTNTASAAQQHNWTAPNSDGWIVDHNTGQARQVYTPENPLKLGVQNKALADQTNSYIDSLNLSLPDEDKSALALDIQVKAKPLIQQGVQPSLALQAVYNSLKDGVIPKKGWFSDSHSYSPSMQSQGVINSDNQILPQGTAVSTQAPQAAINLLKSNNTPTMRAHFKNKYGYLPEL